MLGIELQNKNKIGNMLPIHQYIWRLDVQKQYGYKILHDLPDDEKIYNTFIKIAIIRNPLDRFLSGILYLIIKENYIIKNNQETLLQYAKRCFKNKHLWVQTSHFDLNINWDYVLDINQWIEFKKILTDIFKHKQSLEFDTNHTHFLKYSDFENTKIYTVQDLKRSHNQLSKNLENYFTFDEILEIKDMLRGDIFFYEKFIENK
jgi:hypothetical protein